MSRDLIANGWANSSTLNRGAIYIGHSKVGCVFAEPHVAWIIVDP